MNWKSGAVLLPLSLALVACASEGGSRGSGIGATLQGNVIAVQTAALSRPGSSGPSPRALLALRALLQVERTANAETEVEGIQVTIQGTSFQGRTDASGRFTIQGNFEGDLNVIFMRADLGTASIAINVPAAGTLTLNNVAIDAQQGTADAETQGVDFEGSITGVYCSVLTMTMVSTEHSAGDADSYTVKLDTSSLLDSHGNPISCEQLREGQQAAVQGTVNPDGSFGHAQVQLQT